MPQPFPKDFRESTFKMGRTTQERPGLCLLGMTVITHYVNLEVTLTNVFLSLLGAEPGPAVAMLTAIKNNNVRNEAFRAVAETVLSREKLELLNAVLAKCETADKERNRIAHWVWATEEKLPDAVILIDPRKYAAFQQKIKITFAMETISTEDASSLQQELRNAALVYRKQDFETAYNHIQRAISLSIALMIYVKQPDGNPEGAKARQMLLDAPEIQQWLARSRNSTPQNSDL